MTPTEFDRFCQQHDRWGHLSIAESYDLMDELVAALKALLAAESEGTPRDVMIAARAAQRVITKAEAR